MLLDSASRTGPFSHDEDPRNRAVSPSTVARNEGRQSRLAVKGHKRRSQVGDYRLDLDYQQRARLRMPTQHVDRPSLAADRERSFDGDLPARPFQSPNNGVNQVRVVGVQ